MGPGRNSLQRLVKLLGPLKLQGPNFISTWAKRWPNFPRLTLLRNRNFMKRNLLATWDINKKGPKTSSLHDKRQTREMWHVQKGQISFSCLHPMLTAHEEKKKSSHSLSLVKPHSPTFGKRPIYLKSFEESLEKPRPKLKEDMRRLQFFADTWFIKKQHVSSLHLMVQAHEFSLGKLGVPRFRGNENVFLRPQQLES